MACHKGRKPPPYTLEPRTPEIDASAVTASRSLPTRRHEAGQNRGGATPSPVRGSCTVILGRAHRRTAQLAVACMCGQLPPRNPRCSKHTKDQPQRSRRIRPRPALRPLQLEQAAGYCPTSSASSDANQAFHIFPLPHPRQL